MYNKTDYQNYLEALLKSDESACHAIIISLLNQNIDILTLYTDFFQHSMYEVGELWEKNKISVATEHAATQITQQMLMLAYPRLISVRKIGKKAVIASIANEYHQLGAHMVSDIFQLHGWHTFFLGSNTPSKDIVLFIEQHNPDLLGLSLSIYFNFRDLVSTIHVIRDYSIDLPILVGGQAFQWGGRSKLEKMLNVEYISSLHELDDMLQNSNP